MSNMTSLGHYREQRGWSLSELARRSGLSKSTVFNVERGSSDPTLSTLERLAGALGIKVAELLGDEGPLPARAMTLARALSKVAAERSYQILKWGEQNHRPEWWLAILVEEVGELATAILRAHFGTGEDERRETADVRAEAIQVAAVAVALVECLDRNELSLEGVR